MADDEEFSDLIAAFNIPAMANNLNQDNTQSATDGKPPAVSSTNIKKEEIDSGYDHALASTSSHFKLNAPLENVSHDNPEGSSPVNITSDPTVIGKMKVTMERHLQDAGQWEDGFTKTSDGANHVNNTSAATTATAGRVLNTCVSTPGRILHKPQDDRRIYVSRKKGQSVIQRAILPRTSTYSFPATSDGIVTNVSASAKTVGRFSRPCSSQSKNTVIMLPAVLSHPQKTVSMSVSKRNEPLLASVNNASLVAKNPEDVLKEQILSRTNLVPPCKYPKPPAGLCMSNELEECFTCSFCGDSFAFKSSLDYHMARKSVNINFKCKECSRVITVTNKCLVPEHYKRIHKLDSAKLNNHVINVYPLSKDIQVFCTDEVLQSSVLQPIPVDYASQRNDSSPSAENGTINGERVLSPLLISTADGQVSTPAPPLPPLRSVSPEKDVIRCTFCRKHVGDSEVDLKNHFSPSGYIKSIFACGHRDCTNKVLPTKCALDAHKILHSQQPPYVCPECGQTIHGSFEIFMKHVHKKCLHHSRALSFKCDQCFFIREVPDELLSHMLKSHTHSFIKCKLCPVAFRTTVSWQEHNRKEHPLEKSFSMSKIFKCHMCSTVFVDQGSLSQHLLAHIHNTLSMFMFKCRICHTSHYADKGKLIAHLHADHHVSPILEMCSHCGVEQSTMQSLQKHMATCHPGPHGSSSMDANDRVKTVFKCPKCKFLFMSKAEVISHLGTVHKANILPMSPTLISPKKSPSIVPIEVSSKAETPTQNGPCCPVCLKTYSNRRSLLKHIARHESKSQYVCKKCCQVFFYDYSELLDHQVTCHIRHRRSIPLKKSPAKDDDKFKSPLIDDEMEQKVNLKSDDDEVDNGYEPMFKEEMIKCDHCDQEFPALPELHSHMKSTHGISPCFSCQLCGLAYADSESLNEHKLRVHEGKGRAYRCYLCQENNKDTLYYKKYNLERHIISYHKVPKVNIEETRIKKIDVDLEPGKNHEVEGGVGDKRALDLNVKSESSPASVRKLRVDGDAVYNCAKCIFSTEERKEFHEHIGVHKTDDESIQCLECGTCFMVQPALKKHLVIVHKVRNFKKYYQDTGVDYDTVKETDVMLPAVAAVNRKHKGNVGPLECRVCYKAFENVAVLQHHMRTHGVAFIRSKRRAPGASGVESLGKKRCLSEEVSPMKLSDNKSGGTPVKLEVNGTMPDGTSVPSSECYSEPTSDDISMDTDQSSVNVKTNHDSNSPTKEISANVEGTAQV